MTKQENLCNAYTFASEKGYFNLPYEAFLKTSFVGFKGQMSRKIRMELWETHQINLQEEKYIAFEQQEREVHSFLSESEKGLKIVSSDVWEKAVTAWETATGKTYKSNVKQF